MEACPSRPVHHCRMGHPIDASLLGSGRCRIRQWTQPQAYSRSSPHEERYSSKTRQEDLACERHSSSDEKQVSCQKIQPTQSDGNCILCCETKTLDTCSRSFVSHTSFAGSDPRACLQSLQTLSLVEDFNKAKLFQKIPLSSMGWMLRLALLPKVRFQMVWQTGLRGGCTNRRILNVEIAWPNCQKGKKVTSHKSSNDKRSPPQITIVHAFMKKTEHDKANHQNQQEVKQEINYKASWSHSSIDNIYKVNFIPTASRRATSPIITNKKYWKPAPSIPLQEGAWG